MESPSYAFEFGEIANLASTSDDRPTEPPVKSTLLIGKRESLQKLNAPALLGLELDRSTVEAMLDSITGSKGGTASTFVHCSNPKSSNQHHLQQLILATIPDTVSRNNHPLSVHTVTEHISNSKLASKNTTTSRILFCGSEMLQHKGALASALAKAFPLYSQKTIANNGNSTTAESEQEPSSSISTTTIQVSFVTDEGQQAALDSNTVSALTAVCEGVQLAARLVDSTPEELSTTAYAAECRRVADQVEGVTVTEIVGEELLQKGYGGLFGVGKAAVSPPRLVVLDYIPPENTSSTETVALVGKGIIYDTGGLSLKPKVGMCGMKHDMGGSAGLLGGFYAATKLRTPPSKRIVLVLCLAENAIGPTAFRNDDILTLYSGKTVEINNCDAEGRLVLGDGVAHATRHIENLDLVVDMATLTGAQLVATGKKHAGVLANTAALEQRAVQAGLASGDLVYPLLYAPELLRGEFDSKVADMKNSVKDRSNAQSSCAGHFIEAHLHPDYKGGWLHVDMAGPASKNERGTGYGVGLVLSLLETPGFC